ncbi:probable protein phosphatase 2C 72 [Impatiens glandulifera]|uniref:probable protein phosphatase 2C 72 n=1 Tax=Impatiens glandulifera TaxID=253017 RepID=UPI001FB0F334|nr:probable protein phosphatase 2C 72 [Impatiens glandulifera]
MGLCISKGSAEIYVEDDDCQESVVSYGISNSVSSLFSLEGNKGVNQDAAVLFHGYGTEDVTFCAVYDGHGKNGHRVSKLVRNRLLKLMLNLKEEFAKNKNSPSHVNEIKMWEEACMSAFRVMDKEIKLLDNFDCSLSGTTEVVVLRKGEHLLIANLGDSRAILGTMNDDGGMTAVKLTTDLKPSVPTEGDRIRRSNGRVLALRDEPHIDRVWLPHEDSPGLAMSRSFGDLLLKNHGIISIPEVSFHHLTSKDHFLFLATDGVWDVMSNDEVATIVESSDTGAKAAECVVNAAVSKWRQKFPSSKRDDITALCLFLADKTDDTISS